MAADLRLGSCLVKRLLSSALLLGLVAAVVPSVASAETYNATPTPTWIPQGAGGAGGGGQVWAMAVTPTRIYLGGDFTSLRNPATNATFAASNLVAIDRATGNPTSAFVAPVVADASGLDGNGYRLNPAVSSLDVAADGSVYVGGNYTSIDGVARGYVAKISSAGVMDATWNPGVSGPVRDLELSANDADLYMVGQFQTVGGASHVSAAKVSATGVGALDPVFDANMGTVGRASSIKVTPSLVYLGGDFTMVDGQNQLNLASVDATTGDVTTWRPNAGPSDTICNGNGVEFCKVLDLDVDEAGKVYAAIAGNGGGFAAAWDNGVDAYDWRNKADGDIQAVDVYDGIVYFGGHFEASVTDYFPTIVSPRNQFYAANPADGATLPYSLPTTTPATPGVRVIRADESALRIGGTTNLSGGLYSNFLTFAQPNFVIPGPPPTSPPATTTVTVKLKGCPTCKVRLTQKRGSGALWDSKWKTASKGVAVFTVPTSKTVGLTATVDAPWEKKFKKTAEVVMRYKGKAVGAKVSAKAAAKMKKASSCYAGTTAKTLTFTVSVKKAKAGAKVGTRAWVQKTQLFRNPTRKAPKGVLSIKKPTTCT